MEILKTLNLGIAFLLELAMLVIYGFFGYRLLPAESVWDPQNWTGNSIAAHNGGYLGIPAGAQGGQAAEDARAADR